MYLRLVCFTVALGVLAGCESTAEPPSPTDRDAGGGPPPTRLVLEGMGSVALLFGERADLVFRYTEADGSPIAGAAVGFALEGRAQDSSLAQITATTDSDGRALGTVIAGRTSTAFRVRASADRAAAAYVDVAVGDLGFGALEVTPAYLGLRAITSRQVDLFSAVSCADAARAPAADRTFVLDPGETVARFRALPVGLQYAVRARALGASGAPLAEGCVEGVMVAADVTTPTSVTLADLPLDTTGFYRTEILVDDTAPASTVATTARSAGLAPVTAAGGDAAFYLDAIEAWLRSGRRDADADALAAARAAGTIVESLDLRLAAGGAGPRSAVEDVAAMLARRMDVATVGGALSLGVVGSAMPSGATWTDSSLLFGNGDPDARRIPMDLAALHVDPRARVMVGAVGGPDRRSLDSLTLSLPLGTLTLGVLDAVARESDGIGLADLLMARGGCDALDRFVAEEPAMLGLCDSTCATSSCKQALEGVATSVSTALLLLDTQRSTLSLSGTLTLADSDADARAETLSSSDLAGAWSSDDGSSSDSLSATASASEIPPLP